MPKKTRNEIKTRFTADDRFSRSVGVMSRGMQRLNRISGHVKRGLRSAGRAAMFLGKKAKKFAIAGMVGITAAATATFYSITKLAGEMDVLAKTSRSINFPIEEFQEWRFAAEQSGVSQETFGRSMQKLTRSLGEMKGGYGSLFSALKKSNPQLLKQLRGTKDTSDALGIYLRAIREIPSATGKAALSAAGFGRAGIDMINLANESDEAIAKLRNQMRQNGVVTAEQAAKAEMFNDSFNRLKLTAKSLAVDGLTPLMPLFERGSDMLRKWIIENRGLIRQKIHMAFEKIYVFGKKAFSFLSTNVPPLISKLEQLGKEGFSWVKENSDELKSFASTVSEIGKIALKTAEFIIKHKYAVLSLVVAYKSLGFAMKAMEWSAMVTGANSVGGAVSGLSGKVGKLAGMVGKGGLLVTAFAAGWAVGSVIFDNWNKAAANLALNAENMAARVSLAFNKMSGKELEATDRQLAAKEKKLTSTFESVKAFVTGNYQEHQAAIKAVKSARVKGLSEQLSRLEKGNRLVEERNRLGFESGRQSGGTGDSIPLNPVERPQAQSSYTERVEKSITEVVIKDETGRAEITRGRPIGGLATARNGGM